VEQVFFMPPVPGVAVAIVRPSGRFCLATRGQRTPPLWHASRLDAFAPDNSPRARTEADEIDAGNIMPGFRIRASEIFQ
jgi:hypothetical protein